MECLCVSTYMRASLARSQTTKWAPVAQTAFSKAPPRFGVSNYKVHSGNCLHSPYHGRTLTVRGMHQSEDLLLPDSDLASQSGARRAVLNSFDLKGVAERILEGKASRIVTMVGAGISVSSGIPDFRSPSTGLYDNLQKYSLPYPEAIFDLDYFREKPDAFNMLAKELYPGKFAPTPTHLFMRLLHHKGLLLRCFTQNIDSLETLAGLPEHKIVAAHGNFDTAHCIRCHALADKEVVRATLEADGKPTCTACGGLVKPNIVFFGERLPDRFFTCAQEDMRECDLLMVMGTSLQVQPFAGLVGQVPLDVPRLLINREMVGVRDSTCNAGFGTGYFEFGVENTRDAAYLGNCDDGVQQLVDMLDWRSDFDNMFK
mmetsp:Transcript_39265/g.73673  ORF Transcript_39265/g.73673 Transcript_39265/m.73673 type:complete len:372 (-) Transcript_39265:139-1254(-)